MAISRKPLLAPGNEAEWAKINRADAEQLRASNLALTPTQQAVSLLAASGWQCPKTSPLVLTSLA
jgi:hypothetical protein